MGKRTLLLLTAVCVAVVNLLHAQEPELTTARFDSLYKVTEQVRGVNPDSAITLATNLLINRSIPMICKSPCKLSTSGV